MELYQLTNQQCKLPNLSGESSFRRSLSFSQVLPFLPTVGGESFELPQVGVILRVIVGALPCVTHIEIFEEVESYNSTFWPLLRRDWSSLRKIALPQIDGKSPRVLGAWALLWSVAAQHFVVKLVRFRSPSVGRFRLYVWHVWNCILTHWWKSNNLHWITIPRKRFVEFCFQTYIYNDVLCRFN